MVTGGILQYSEDSHFTANEDIGPKDFFVMACSVRQLPKRSSPIVCMPGESVYCISRSTM